MSKLMSEFSKSIEINNIFDEILTRVNNKPESIKYPIILDDKWLLVKMEIVEEALAFDISDNYAEVKRLFINTPRGLAESVSDMSDVWIVAIHYSIFIKSDSIIESETGNHIKKNHIRESLTRLNSLIKRGFPKTYARICKSKGGAL